MNRSLRTFLLQALSLVTHDDRSKVIYYHDIGVKHTAMGTDLELFRTHVAIARERGYDFVRGDEYLRSTAEKNLLVCFDDGFRGVYEEREYFMCENLFPMIFIAVGLVGQKGYLTWDEIRNLHEAGFSFESHTWSHRSLTTVPSNEFEHELVDSKKELEQQLGQEVNQLCFPRGLFSPRVMGACERAGYTDLFTSMPEITGDGVSPLTGSYNMSTRLIPRILAQSASSREFRCLLLGAMSVFAKHYLSRDFIEKDK